MYDIYCAAEGVVVIDTWPIEASYFRRIVGTSPDKIGHARQRLTVRDEALVGDVAETIEGEGRYGYQRQ